MRLTRLEIFGFKSFVERFVLNFDRNKIGIVGPNGCGKSNIVDALRWVLGETYAKQLRGNVLEDLIFNGSETRRPLGMAEVIITIRPDSNWSDNLRLQELKETLKKEGEEGTAADARSADSSEQNTAGNDDSLVAGDSAVANDRTNSDDSVITVDEVLGERAAAATGNTDEDIEGVVLPQVLREVPGLLHASEIQFTRRLYRSGESEYFINRISCRLRDMIDVYRVIGLGARGLSIVQQGEISQFISKKPIERRELLEEAAGISGFRNRMEIAQRKLEKTAENMDRLRDIMEEVEKQVRVLKRQATRARERNELKASILRDDLALYRAKRVRLLLQQHRHTAALAGLNERFIGAQAAMMNVESRQGELQAELEEFETLISDKRRMRDSLQLAFERERERIQRLEVARVRTEGELDSAGREKVQSEERVERLAEEAREIEARCQALQERIREASEKREAAENALRALQTDESRKQILDVDLARAKEAVPEALREEILALEQKVGRVLGVETELKELERDGDERRRELDRSRKQLHGVEIQLTSADSEVRSLKKQLEALADEVVRATGEPSSEEAAGRKVLLAGLRVPENVQRAVSALLGEKAQYLLTEDSLHAARGYAERVQRGANRPGRIGVIDAASVIEPDRAAAEELTLTDEDRAEAPSARRLIEAIAVDAGLDGVVGGFLGGYFFVETLDEAIRLNARLRAPERGALRKAGIVTANGEVFTPWGWYTSEGKGASFSFTRRIEEVQNQKRELETQREQLHAQVEECEKSSAMILEKREALVRERRELGESDRRLSALHRQVLEIERHERDRLIAQARLRQEQLLREEREAQERLRTAVGETAKLQQQEESARSRLRQIAGEQERCESAQHGLSEREEELRAEIERLTQEIEQGMLLEGEMTVSEFHSRCETLDRELKELGSKREPIRLTLSELSAEVADHRRESHHLEESIRSASLQEERSRLELGMLSEELLRQYPESEEVAACANEEIRAELATEKEAIEELLRLNPEEPLPNGDGALEKHIQATHESLIRLRKRLEREGEVDPQSIELFEQEDARLRGMQEQYADLDEAKRILENTIRRLKDVSRRRFLETFSAVNKKFQELIPRLFGGGAGHLELLNPEDPLTSGVELMVRPPGKRLGSMELMSGGEKCLVAISVLIAMFLHRPSPICVLDEVDAPLDEANLERYLALISEISRNTQFLIITHNKRTMSEVDRLIGITMQEKGVSTALTVALEDAPAILESVPAGATGEQPGQQMM